jgi:hypothetical protein
MKMLTTIWLTIKTRAMLLLTIAAGLLAVAFRIKQSGRQAERIDNLEATLKAIKTKEGVRNETVRLPDGAAADRLRNKWSRD